MHVMLVQIENWYQQCATVRHFHPEEPAPGGMLASMPLMDLDADSVEAASLEGEELSESDDDEEEAATHGLVYLRKVLITPLRVLPYPATPEESNRILRQCAPQTLFEFRQRLLLCTSLSESAFIRVGATGS
jgi:hypothetical protein